MKRVITTSIGLASTDAGAVGNAWDEVSASFDRFCLAAGVDALGAMMEKDAEEACGARHVRSEGRRGHRWGRTQGKIGFHAGKVTVERRPRRTPSWLGCVISKTSLWSCVPVQWWSFVCAGAPKRRENTSEFTTDYGIAASIVCDFVGRAASVR